MAGTRRGNGEGTEIKERNGSYYTQVWVGGRRVTVTAKIKAEVRRKVRELLGNADRGLLPPRERLTLREWAERWLADVVKRSVRARTYEFYSDTMRRYILPTLGNVRLADLQPSRIERLYSELLEHRSEQTKRELTPQTVRHAHTVLHACIEQALRRGLVSRNVVSIVEPPRAERKEVEALSSEQVKALLAAARDSRYEALLTLAVATGMRQSELLGLTWEAVDLDARAVHVVRQLGRDGAFSEPKTGKGRRRVGLPASVLPVLREHRARQLEEQMLLGVRTDLVFTTRSGRPVGHRNLLRDFKALLKKAGLPDVSFHALRHTHASLLFAQGVHGKVVQERLGHSSIAITLDRYSHMVPSLDRDAADRLDAMLA